MNALDDIRIRTGADDITEEEAAEVIDWCRAWYADCEHVFTDAVTEETISTLVAAHHLPTFLRQCDIWITGGLRFVLEDVRRCAVANAKRESELYEMGRADAVAGLSKRDSVEGQTSYYVKGYEATEPAKMEDVNGGTFLTISLYDFATLEHVIGAMDTDGLETLRISRREGVIYLAVDHPANGNGVSCSLADWATNQAQTMRTDFPKSRYVVVKHGSHYVSGANSATHIYTVKDTATSEQIIDPLTKEDAEAYAADWNESPHRRPGASAWQSA